MSSFAQTLEGDIALVHGRLKLVTGAEEKAQKINNRLRLFLGEWFLDTRVGTPWYGVILGVKNPELVIIRRLFRTVIMSVDGIADVEELDLRWDRETRELAWDFRVLDDEGTEIVGGSQTPFIVETP